MERWLEDARRQFRKYKALVDGALAQVEDDRFFEALGPEENSVGVILKHMAGNMRSRWTDFLTADGEKPDRGRDREFEAEPGDTRSSVTARWEDGWERLFAALEPLGSDDLERSVTIRGEPHTVLQAVHRQMTHYAYHAGQVVLLARHFAGDRWESLSIPRGRSREFEVSKDGTRREER